MNTSFFILYYYLLNVCDIITTCSIFSRNDLEESMSLSELIESALSAANHANIQIKKVLDYSPPAETLENLFIERNGGDNYEASIKDKQPPDVKSFEILIPGNLASKIIGKGGEVIQAIRKETGAIIDLIQDGPEPELAFEKLLRIMGTVDNVENARWRVEQFLGVAVKQRISIPSDKVGILIGEGGNTLRMIRSVSGANVFVDPKPPHGAKERIVIITGNNEEVVEAARKLVEKFTKQKEKVRQPQDVRPFDMMIPGNLVGKIIGKGGEVIKSLQKETGAKINVIQDWCGPPLHSF